MNIFVLSTDPILAAQMQCDKHVVKMTLESAQMLSTAHRVLDGTPTKIPSKSGKRMINAWKLDDPIAEKFLYKSVHVNHPCTQWTMESAENYRWHFEHFSALAREFNHRFHKPHLSWTTLCDALTHHPKNIESHGLTPFRLAMGDYPHLMDPQNPVESYRAFYKTKQSRFEMKWTNRHVPEWFMDK